MKRLKLIISLLVIVSLAACSKGSSSSSPSGAGSPTVTTLTAQKWASGVCTAVVEWTKAIDSHSFVPQGTDIASIKQGWLAYLDQSIQDTDAMIAKVDALDPPDVPNAQVSVDLNAQALQRIRSAYESARTKSEALPTDARFMAKFQKITGEFQRDIDRAGAVFKSFGNASLDAAFEAEPACSELKS